MPETQTEGINAYHYISIASISPRLCNFVPSPYYTNLPVLYRTEQIRAQISSALPAMQPKEENKVARNTSTLENRVCGQAYFIKHLSETLQRVIANGVNMRLASHSNIHNSPSFQH
jgi:hypothetical protein